jgi:DNA ligase-associated metallophosphoesterase
VQLNWGGEQFILLPARCVYWPRQSTVIISDPHFGKTSAFRVRGVPLPRGTTATDLEALSRVLKDLNPQRLLILGDVFHSREWRNEHLEAQLKSWRAGFSQLEIVVIPGNHDVHAGLTPNDLNFTIRSAPVFEEHFCFTHFPPEPAQEYTFCGHIHPGCRLRDRDGSRVRVPCFWLRQKICCLPAFGSFTGLYMIKPDPGDRLFAIGPDCLLEVPPELAA